MSCVTTLLSKYHNLISFIINWLSKASPFGIMHVDRALQYHASGFCYTTIVRYLNLAELFFSVQAINCCKIFSADTLVYYTAL